MSIARSRLAPLLVLLAVACSEPDAPASPLASSSAAPAEVGTALTQAQIEMGYSHSCLVRADGSLTCWGDNSRGQISIPATLGPVLQVSSQYDHTCAVTAKRKVVCWGGNNSAGELNVPASVGAAREVSVGQTHSCALRLDRTVVCWGESTNPVFFPLVVPTGLAHVASVTSGPNYVCAVLKTGALTCFGDRDDGEADVPAGVAGVTGAFGGYEQPCITVTGGRPFCWGQGWSPSFTTPVPNVESSTLNQIPAGLTGVRKLGGGNGRTCAVTTAGSLYCWTGTTDHLPLATHAVATDAPVVAFDFHVQSGGYCVITSNRTIQCSSGANAGVAAPATID